MSQNRIHLILPLLACAALGACSADNAKTQAALTPTEQFPLEAHARPDEVRLAPHTAGLSDAQTRALADFADRWLSGRDVDVTIQVPIRGADPAAADTTSRAAQILLASLGVPAERLQRVGYEPQAAGAPPIIVGFKAYEAVVPRCGRNFDRINANVSNKPMANFGCAVSANMAAQIADPGDILAPRDLAPADAGRRTTVMGKYRKGVFTSTQPDPQGSGAISSGVPTTSGSGGSGG